MKRFILLSFFLILSYAIFAANVRDIQLLIPYSNSITVRYNNSNYLLQCVNKGLVDTHTGLPLYIFSEQIDDTTEIISVEVTPIKTEEIHQDSSRSYDVVVDSIKPFSFTWNVSSNRLLKDLKVFIPSVYSLDGRLISLKEVNVHITYNSNVRSRLKSASTVYSSESVLSKGKWVKVRVDKTGIYQLDYSTLVSWGFANPSRVKVYGNGGDMLPRLNKDNTTNDLIENGTYDNGRSLMFYAKGVVNWKYNASQSMYIHELNDYDSFSYYYITESDSEGKHFEEQIESSTHTQSFNEFVAYDFYEKNSQNLLNSGKQWVGDSFVKTTLNFNTKDVNYNSTNGIRIAVGVVSRSEKSSAFEININKSPTSNGTIICSPVYYAYKETDYAVSRIGYFNSSIYNSNTEVAIKYNEYTSNSTGWLDFVTINYKQNLIFRDGYLAFRNPNALGEFTEYRLAGAANRDLIVLDVTNPISPIRMNTKVLADTISVVADGDILREFIVFDPKATFSSPVFVENIENQNLHGIEQSDYVIVTPSAFLGEAKNLSSIHSQYNSINPLVVTTEQVYNEFSSGKQDPLAIRSFMRMLFLRANGDATKVPKYLLLYGDGSYDNLGIVAKNRSIIVTCQSDISLHPTQSYVSDDIFGFLNDNEGVNDKTDGLDIGIGRFVINDLNEARVANSKVLAYLTQQDDTDWQTRLTFLAQDGDYNRHQRDAEILSVGVRAVNPEFNVNKIYTDAYQKEATSQFASFPGAESAINQALVTNGSLIFNYTGHGSVTAIAYNFLTRGKVDKLNNIRRLPFFVTASCEVSRFDNPEENSLGEHIFRNPIGGGIGLLSTTRVVYSSQNLDLNRNFYSNVFSKDTDGEPFRIGDVVRLTKNASEPTENKLNFTLLCDPGLTLNYPKNRTRLTDISNARITSVKDTLNGLTHGRVEGEVLDKNGQLKADYNGTATITLYDKISKNLTLGNSGQVAFEYESYDNILYRGKVTVSNGHFLADFIVPQDIRYDYGKGKFSLYTTDGKMTNSFGVNNDVVIGSLDPFIGVDDDGPQVELFLNSYSFKNGQKIGLTPLFIANLSDLNSINTSGSGIGHDLLLTLDDDPLNSYVLNDFFEFSNESYQNGIIKYQLPPLTVGNHKLTFKSWDCYNNSTTKSITFQVVADGELGLDNILLYPNPMRESQALKIFFNHDEPNSTLNIELKIYTLEGLQVNQMYFVKIDHNGVLPLIEWLPETSSGNSLSSGMYICQLNIISSTGEQTVFSKRFIVL